MSRLAEYMGELARLLGRSDQVHFARLEEGSTVLVQTVESEAIPKWTNGSRPRVRPDDVARAFSALNRYLADDNATGMHESAGVEMIRFRLRATGTGRCVQSDGVLIRIGGKDDTPAHLRDGDRIPTPPSGWLSVSRVHLYARSSRARGRSLGTRCRWRLGDEAVNITNFEELVMHPLSRLPEASRRRWERLHRRSQKS